MFNIEMLKSKSDQELTKILNDLGVRVAKNHTGNDLIFNILDFQASNPTETRKYYNAVELASSESEVTAPPEEKKAPARRKKAPVKKKPVEESPSTENSQTESPNETEQQETTELNQEPAATKNKTRRKSTKATESAPDSKISAKDETPKSESDNQIEESNTQPQQKQNPPRNPQPTRQNKQRNSGDHPNQKGSREQANANPQQNNQNSQNTNQNNQNNSNQNNPNPNQNNPNQNRNPNQQKRSEQKEVAESKKEYNFDGLVTIEGVLEILPDNYGFLRSSDFSYISSPDDVYVSTAQIRNYGLKTGDTVRGIVRLPKEGEKYFSLQKPTEVNGRDLDFIKDRVAFEYLTPLFPQEKFNLAEKGSTISTRIVDLFAPIGKGQRAMIVAQPKTGKTTLLKEIANAISSNHPEAYMMVLLIDERPEEVTDMERSVNGEVIASTFDESAEKHVKVANLVLSKAQRMVECGHDVVILLDSITRLARAYNTVTPASGKVLSGGVDANALHKPKRFFGAARKIENGGSLTIIGTALIDTGSKMDEVIFEEFKGTGNMELQLDRRIANKRVYPAIDLMSSSTRRDDLLHDESTQQRMWILRKYLADMNPIEAMEFVEQRIKSTINNQEFLISMNGK